VGTTQLTSVSQQLQTIGDYIRFASSQFNQADLFFGHGSDNAWDEAVALIMFAIHLPVNVSQQVLSYQLVEEEKNTIIALIEQRINKGIPAAYITNQVYFANLPFFVDERVLVPRSPIAELIKKRFTPYINELTPPSRILDLCTGSGCIAIACAIEFPDSDVDAVDLSIDALNVAQINIENHGLSEQVIPIHSDVFSGVENLTYDLIVTNPPYVDQEDMASLPLEYTHEPEMGLGSGVDGLDVVRQILAQSAQHLNDNGILICEVGNSQIHVEALYPHVPFIWIDFEDGGHGVFMLTKAQLEEFSSAFQQQLV
jgi:ribosomal protein L3 glutamine methyltransferase